MINEKLNNFYNEELEVFSKLIIPEIIQLVKSYSLDSFFQLDSIETAPKIPHSISQIIVNKINEIQHQDSQFSKILNMHGVHAVLKYKDRNPSFYVIPEYDLNSLHLASWYLFEYSNKIVKKKLAINWEKNLKTNLPNSEELETYIPSIYYIWKKYFKKNNFNWNSKNEIISSYRDDLKQFNSECYNSNIAEELFLPPWETIKKKSLNSIFIGSMAIDEIEARKQKYKNQNFEDFLALALDISLHFPHDLLKTFSFGPDFRHFAKAKVNYHNNKNCSLFALLAFFSTATRNGKDIYKEIEYTDIEEWFHDIWLRVYPSSSIFANEDLPHRNLLKDFDDTVAIVANWESSSGLTVNALMTESALNSEGIKTIRISPRQIQTETIEESKNFIKNVIYHVGVEDVPDLITATLHQNTKYFFDKSYGFYLWETATVPPAHELSCALVDKILVPTEFLRKAYTDFSPQKTCSNVGKYIILPKEEYKNKELKKSLEGKYSFLTIFDPGSGIERKNPLALVEAYTEEFQENEGAVLILKAGKIPNNHWGDPFCTFEKILEITKNRKDIIIIDNYLSDNELHGLIKLSSCLVSTHRGEGFGYLLSYAVLRGKPLIYSDFSGLDEFSFNSENCLPIKGKIIDAPFGKFYHDHFKARWFDPSIASTRNNLRKSFTKKLGLLPVSSKVKDYYSINKYAERIKKEIQL